MSSRIRRVDPVGIFGMEYMPLLDLAYASLLN